MAICSLGLSCARNSSATGRTISPARLVSSRNITSTMSEEYSAASAFRASLSSQRVKSPAFSPRTGLLDFASTTVTDTLFAAAAGSAHKIVKIQNLLLNLNPHPRIETGDLRSGDTLVILNTFDDLGVVPEAIANFDIAGLDQNSLDDIDLVRAEHVVDRSGLYQLDQVHLIGVDAGPGVGAGFQQGVRIIDQRFDDEGALTLLDGGRDAPNLTPERAIRERLERHIGELAGLDPWRHALGRLDAHADGIDLDQRKDGRVGLHVLADIHPPLLHVPRFRRIDGRIAQLLALQVHCGAGPFNFADQVARLVQGGVVGSLHGVIMRLGRL